MKEHQNLSRQDVIDDLIAQYEKFGLPLSGHEKECIKQRLETRLLQSRILGSLPPMKGQLTLGGSAAMHILRRKLYPEKDETKRAKIEEMLRRIEDMESRSTSHHGCGVPAAWTVFE